MKIIYFYCNLNIILICVIICVVICLPGAGLITIGGAVPAAITAGYL